MGLKETPTSRARLVFGACICFMFIAVVATLIFLPIPAENRSAVDILLGTLSATMGAVYNFYFGSSEGSKSKTDIVDKTLYRSQKAVTQTLPPYNNDDDLKEVEEHYENVDSQYNSKQPNPSDTVTPFSSPNSSSRNTEK